ncbi:MAG: plastocyanin/azurin family copper-binding protein [Chloroflexi bacterium]|nr:plastocyanin/azurin family copper-binding protein [Chloroflexota bacterium]
MTRVIGMAAVVVLVLAACGSSATDEDGPATGEGPDTVVLSAPAELATAALPANDAAPPGIPPDSAGGSFGFSRYVYEELGDEIVTTLVEGPLAMQVRAPVSYLQLKELQERGDSSDHLSLDSDELAALVEQLDTLRDATEKYKDVQLALDDGFVRATDEVPNMGAHFVNGWRSLNGEFDPAKPEVLLYVTDDSGEWELVGTSFVLPTQFAGLDHPEAFAGPLDNWHVHYQVCTGPNTISRSSTADECQANGGVWAPTLGWMIRAWVWVDNPLGVFNMWNPNLPPVVDGVEIEASRSTASAVGAARTVPIQNFGFEESRVKAGEALAWINVDGVPHTVTAGSRGQPNGGVDSGLIAPGQSFAVRFDHSGEYSFTCTLHPFMTTTVVVEE